MTKPKKRKTNHQHQHQKGLTNDPTTSHEEIWDDSALLRSWNDAVAEYEYYHSIHARGEDVDEVLRKAEEEEEQQRRGMRTADGAGKQTRAGNAGKLGGDMQMEMEDGEVEAEEGEVDEDEDGEINEEDDLTITASGDATKATKQDTRDGLGENAAAATSVQTSGRGGKPGPEPAAPTTAKQHTPHVPGSGSANVSTTQAGSGTDQTLENIKMAYYWAGYYSGLHDGQQQ